MVRQSSSAIEEISKNGIKKRVHVVVKNNPFLLQIAVANTLFPAKSIPLEAYLVYDEGNKDVDFVKVKPVEFKTSANEFDKGVITMEVKIKVLSSQLEDSLFRIKVIALHPLTKQKLNGLVVYTEPIKCVSKPSQVLKPKPSLLDKVKSAPAKRKSEEMLEYVSYALEKIEQQCDIQINALAHADTGSICNNNSKPESHASPAQLNLEHAFHQFMVAYGRMDADSRANKIRKFFGGMSFRDQEQSSNLGMQLQESLSKEVVRPTDFLTPSSYCECTTCPHKDELEKFNTFYDAFLTGPGFINE